MVTATIAAMWTAPVSTAVLVEPTMADLSAALAPLGWMAVAFLAAAAAGLLTGAVRGSRAGREATAIRLPSGARLLDAAV